MCNLHRVYVRGYLNGHSYVPEWGHFKVEGKLKYLGAFIGPEAGAQIWPAPVAKYK